MKSIQINTLPVGTVFYVINGCWVGKVIEIDGVKNILNSRGLFEPSDDYVLDIEIYRTPEQFKEEQALLNQKTELLEKIEIIDKELLKFDRIPRDL